MRKTSLKWEVFLCTLHKAGPGRRQPAEAIIPLYHIFAKKSSEILHKKSIYFFSHFVHFDEAPLITCDPSSACTTPICDHIWLKAEAGPAGYGCAGSKTGIVETASLFMCGTPICDAITLKPKTPYLIYIKKYVIILKKDFFKKHLTILKKYDII